jgi:hypothetical protein
MKRIFRVDFLDWSRRSFRKFPKRLPVFCLCVERIGVEKLHNIVSVESIEYFSCYLDRILEVVRSVLD